jgi:amino acid transporter
MTGLDSLCTPALVYLAIAAISLLYMFYNHTRLETMILKVVFSAAWVWILNFLCSKGLEPLSWILVILPYLFMGFLVTLVLALIQSGNLKGVVVPTAAMTRGYR